MRNWILQRGRTAFLLIAAVLLPGVMYCIVKANDKQPDSAAVGSRYGYATFTIQWDNIMPDHQRPKTLRYCFYPSGNGAMIQTEGDATGLRIALPPGTYKLIVFNSDVENLRFHYMNDFEIAEAFLPNGYEEQGKPSMPLYAAVIEAVTINTTSESEYNVLLNPMVQHVYFKIKVNNPQNIKSCEASLSGVASSLNFSTRHIGISSRMTVPFKMERSKDGFIKDLMLLDVFPEKQKPGSAPNNLKLDFIMKDGRTVTSTVNLGSPLAEYDRQNILIEVDASIERSLFPSIVFSNWEVRANETNSVSSLL